MTIKSRGLLIVFEGLDRSGKRYIYNKIEIFFILYIIYIIKHSGKIAS